MFRSQVSEQYCDFPILHQFICKSRISACNLFCDNCKAANFCFRIQFNTSVLFRYTKCPNGNIISCLQDPIRKTFCRIHIPFTLPFLSEKGSNNPIYEITTALFHQALFFSQVLVKGVHNSPINIVEEFTQSWKNPADSNKT